MNTISLKKLLSLRKSWKRGEKTVVFTNGCFDLLHSGHVEILGKAKKLGDLLVVGLNSDSSVRKLKGPKRPLNPVKARAAVLAGLKAVDYVVVFSEETPSLLIEKIRPDILVKGADYRKDEIVGRHFAGKVVRIPLKKGFSTTALIKKIENAS